MAMSRRRRRRSASKRPESTRAYVIAGISVISAITNFLFVHSAITTKGNTINVMGGVGVLFLLAGIVCVILGIRGYRDLNFTTHSRVIGIVAPLIATGMWLYLYIMGMLYG